MLLTAAVASAESDADGEAAVSFERDVMSVLSKAGCNAGTCHGNINGKGGFFLSLRGFEVDFDYRQLVHDAAGRRIDPLQPEQSLILLKPTAEVAHEGGKRFDRSSPEYAILARWIAAGAPGPDESAPIVTRLSVTPEDVVLWQADDELSLQVEAHFSDGSSRDVTRLAVYEPSETFAHVSADGIVRFDQPGTVTILVRYLQGQFPVRVTLRPEDPSAGEFRWSDPPEKNFIDRHVFQRLRQLKLNPAPLADDSVFIRRVYLDVLGVLPTAEQARAFVNDTAPDKRQRLVDDVLGRPEMAEVWALKWSDLIRNEEKTLDATGVELLHDWIRRCFADDLPLGEFVRGLIAARGSTYENPPANYWRAHREPFVRAETTAQVFLGVRLQCAKCHNHPFDRWSQDEYYNWSSLFAGIDYEIVSNERRDRLDKHEFVGEQLVLVKDEAQVDNARTGQAAPPMFLGDGQAVQGDRLEQLAAWISRPDNQMFVEAQVNRVWYHLMGRGLVEPVDDLRLTNPASHPELLRQLADHWVADDLRLKPLLRTILMSRTYQLASQFDSADAAQPPWYDERMYGRAVVRRLSAEQLLDAQSHVLGLAATFEGYPHGTRAGQIAGVERVRRKLGEGDTFLRQFGKPQRLLACECERSDEPTLGQALSLIGDESLHSRLLHPDNRIGRLIAQHGDDAGSIISELFWTALARGPTPSEAEAAEQLVRQAESPRAALEDLTWALINAKELLFRN